MDALLWSCVLYSFENAILNVNAQTGHFNLTTSHNNASGTDIPALFNNTTPDETATVSLPMQTETSLGESTTEYPGKTGPTTEPVTENFTTTEVNVPPDTTTTRTQPTPTIPTSQPLPLSGSLPSPVTDVSSLCPCNLLQFQCDVNCCCDQDCVGDFKLFTSCSVEKLVADTQLCSQDTARYSFSTAEDGSARVQFLVTQEVNPDVFCIQTVNYEAGLSFGTPTVPTEGNFDALFKRLAGFFFSSTGGGETLTKEDPQNPPGYTYGEVILTQDNAGETVFLRLPAPAGTARCSDANPAAFLQDQTTRCMRSFLLEQDCDTLPSLNLQAYTNFSILSVKMENSTLVGIDLTSITLQSLDGTRSALDPADASQFAPVLLGDGEGVVCNNVVLQVRHQVRYNETGEVLSAAAA
ncbi:hypothetical protein AAFF_G00197370, partial [Aldrovandia affinis]